MMCPVRNNFPSFSSINTGTCVATGLFSSFTPVRKTKKDKNKNNIEKIEEKKKHQAIKEDTKSYLTTTKDSLNFKEVFIETSWKNRSFLAVSQAGLVNNLVFGVSWGLFSLYFVSFGISVNDTAFLKALHPGVWGFLQLATGPFSDIV